MKLNKYLYLIVIISLLIYSCSRNHKIINTYEFDILLVHGNFTDNTYNTLKNIITPLETEDSLFVFNLDLKFINKNKFINKKIEYKKNMDNYIKKTKKTYDDAINSYFIENFSKNKIIINSDIDTNLFTLLWQKKLNDIIQKGELLFFYSENSEIHFIDFGYRKYTVINSIDSLKKIIINIPQKVTKKIHIVINPEIEIINKIKIQFPSLSDKEYITYIKERSHFPKNNDSKKVSFLFPYSFSNANRGGEQDKIIFASGTLINYFEALGSRRQKINTENLLLNMDKESIIPTDIMTDSENKGIICFRDPVLFSKLKPLKFSNEKPNSGDSLKLVYWEECMHNNDTEIRFQNILLSGYSNIITKTINYKNKVLEEVNITTLKVKSFNNCDIRATNGLVFNIYGFLVGVLVDRMSVIDPNNKIITIEKPIIFIQDILKIANDDKLKAYNDHWSIQDHVNHIR